jgi:hypothetical protein
MARIESDPCAPPPSHEARVVQYNLLRTMADTPDLLGCGPTFFEKLLWVHDGSKWVVSLEALVDEAVHVPQ